MGWQPSGSFTLLLENFTYIFGSGGISHNLPAFGETINTFSLGCITVAPSPQIKTLQAPYFILSYLFWSLLFSDMTKPSGCCVPVTLISTDPAPAPHPFSSVLLTLILVPRTWPPRISYGGKVVSVCPLKSKLLSFPLFLLFLWSIDDQKRKREKKKRKNQKSFCEQSKLWALPALSWFCSSMRVNPAPPALSARAPAFKIWL